MSKFVDVTLVYSEDIVGVTDCDKCAKPLTHLHTMPATCLFTRLEESSLVPADFLTAQFLQKM